MQRFAARAPAAIPGPPRPAFAGGGQVVQRHPAPGRPPLVHGAAAQVHPGRANPVTGAVQRFGGEGSFAIDPAQIGLARSGGKPLPQALLAKMEAAFGADFSAVRVHEGAQASRIGALAFTTGNDLYFAPGQYQPNSVRGQQLIGHELAHVIQQRQGRVRMPASGVAVVQDRALEAEADRLGLKAAHGVASAPRPVQAKHAPGAFARTVRPPQAILQRMKRALDTTEDALDPETARETKRLRLMALPFTEHNTNFTEFGLKQQSDLSGNAGRPKAKFLTIEGAQKKIKVKKTIEVRYRTTSAIHGFVKVNGGVVNYGNNQGAAGGLKFHMGYKYQNGDSSSTTKPDHKDNPHAEDWTTSGFRAEFEKSEYAGETDGLAKWLTAMKLPVTANTARPDTHVISIWINFSSCLGCATTITNFYDWLNVELGGKFLLRVKFLRPHDLQATDGGASDKAKNFISSIARLRNKGIYVRMQPEASAVRLRGGTEYTEKQRLKLAANHPAVKKALSQEQYEYLTMTWTGMKINRKLPS